jgi:hypothetical protein
MTLPIKPKQALILPRRTVLASGLAGAATLMLGGVASAQSESSSSSAPSEAPTYERDEILKAGSNFLGVTVEALGGAIERIFSDYGDKPTAYIAGEEASGAIGVGLRYGKGNLFMKTRTDPTYVYWQGPSAGFDTGGNASRVFTLVYHLNDPDMVYRRFPGVEGTAYFIGGLGVNYQRAEGIILAPIRAGVGFRLGANVGYLSYSKKRRIFPL